MVLRSSTSASVDYEPGTQPFPTASEAAGIDEPLECDLLIGQILGGRYRVIERLAEGGMGAVYRAEHIALRKEVAIKLVQDSENSDHAMRFLREAMMTSRIDHPNVVSAMDYGTFDDGTSYLVMSLVEGPTLAHAMALERPMWWIRAAEIGAQISDAVAAAHAQGIVHRDLKPENVVLQPMPDGSDVVKVLDFGIAKYARDSLVPPQMSGAQHVTRTGVVVGTPGYMAPEQGIGMRADHRADLYAIGVLLWECIVGRRLWDCDDFQQLLTAQLGTRPPLLRAETGDASIPEALEALVTALLATRPEARPQSAVDTRDRLRSIVEAERHGQARVALRPIAQPKLIVVPPQPTSTVFIEAALARWRALAGDAARDAGANAAQPQTPDVLVLGTAGEALHQPTTQVGFRAGARPEKSDAALDAAATSQYEEPAATDVARVPALAPEAEPADSLAAALPRMSLRSYVAAPLALAIVAAMLWAAPAPGSSTARSSAARGHATPKAGRSVASTSAASPATPELPVIAAATNTPAVSGTAPALRGGASMTPAFTSAQPAAARPTPTKSAGPRVATRASSAHGNAAALRAEARAHFRRAEFELAAQTYRQAIKAAPGYAGAYAGLGASQLALGNARGGIASYEQAIRRSPATSGFHAALGRAWVMAGDRARALAEYSKAVALDPANQVAFNALARLAP